MNPFLLKRRVGHKEVLEWLTVELYLAFWITIKYPTFLSLEQ